MLISLICPDFCQQVQELDTSMQSLNFGSFGATGLGPSLDFSSGYSTGAYGAPADNKPSLLGQPPMPSPPAQQPPQQQYQQQQEQDPYKPAFNSYALQGMGGDKLAPGMDLRSQAQPSMAAYSQVSNRSL